jgi:hypothetical protein
MERGPVVYVPLRPIATALGLNWSAQFRRVQRDSVLAPEARIVAMTATNPLGGDPEVLCLPLDLLPGWLFGIDTARVKPELREAIDRYRRECFRVLWDAFKHDILSAAELPLPATQPSAAALAYELATAVQTLARQQLEFEQRMNKRLDRAAQWARAIEARVGALEITVDPEQPISEAQAAEIALAVKNVAGELEKQGTANPYQQVYGQLYRRFAIGAYRNLPRSKYEAALAWLRERYAELGRAAGQ